MHKYKLVYFNAMGRAELIRMIMAEGAVEYEDYRLNSQCEPKEWHLVKPSAPFGQIPFLEIDGTKYCQSIAIARYLAKEHGLEGGTPEEEALTDMIVNCCEDLVNGTGPIYFERDEEKKEAMRLKLVEKMKGQMAMLEKLLIQNQGGDGWMVGDKMTWADLAVFVYTGSWVMPVKAEPDWSLFPKLDALRQRVMAQPRIADWIERRPKTSF